jgi:hypothetical protein
MKFAQVNWHSAMPAIGNKDIKLNVITGDCEKMKELLHEQMNIDLLDLWSKRSLEGIIFYLKIESFFVCTTISMKRIFLFRSHNEQR